MRRPKKSSEVPGVDRVSAALILSIQISIYRISRWLVVMTSWSSVGRGHFERFGVLYKRV